MPNDDDDDFYFNLKWIIIFYIFLYFEMCNANHFCFLKNDQGDGKEIRKQLIFESFLLTKDFN